MTPTDQSLILNPFGSSHDREDSPRYDWDNRNRGAEPFVIFQYTHAGRGNFWFAGREYAVPAGNAFIATVPEKSRYCYPSDGREPWVFSWINFYGALACQLWSGLRERVGPVISLAPPVARILETLLLRSRRRAWKDPYRASEDAYRFHLEVIRHQHLPKAKAGSIAKSVAYLKSHYQEPLPVKAVAAFAGISREHFTRLFLKQTGESPAAFLRQIRIEAATRLLRSTDLPIAEVAFRTGFASSTKLGLFFRRRYRCSLSAYRKKFRQSKSGT